MDSSATAAKGPGNDRLKYIGVSVIAILVLISFIYIYVKNSRHSPFPATSEIKPTASPQTEAINLDEILTTKGIFMPQDKIVAKVGEEIIYGRDLNFILYDRFPADFVSKTASLEDLKDKAITTAINDSVILQSERKTNRTDLSSDIFNHPDKNQRERKKTVAEITNRRINTEEKVSGGMISVWYHNVSLPSIPLNEAENLAKTTIEKIYNDIKAGRITFQEGGTRILNNSELAKIDPSWRENAYVEFNDRAVDDEPFTYPPLNSLLSSLKEGEMSGIIKIVSPDQAVNPDEEFFAFIKVFKRTNPGHGSFFQWLDKEKNSYEIVIF